MDNVRYFVQEIPSQDAPFREQLIEHLVLFYDILGGIGARSLMSTPILLYALGEANRYNNTVSNGEEIPPVVNSFTLSFTHDDTSYNIRINREHLRETLGDTYWVCSTRIGETFLRNETTSSGMTNNDLERAEIQIRTTLNDIETQYLNSVSSNANIIGILRGPQGRLYLDIQVISNFLYEIRQLLIGEPRDIQIMTIAIRNLFLFLGCFLGPITHISVDENTSEILENIYPQDNWPYRIPRPFALYQSRFEEVYRNALNLPWLTTMHYELRSRTTNERMRLEYLHPQPDFSGRTLNQPLSEYGRQMQERMNSLEDLRQTESTPETRIVHSSENDANTDINEQTPGQLNSQLESPLGITYLLENEKLSIFFNHFLKKCVLS